MFRPENIFLVHGHGQTTKYEKLKQTPFGPLVFEFQRFNVPPLVFTASSRELGINAPPSNELIKGIQQDSFVEQLAIPNYQGAYNDYTSSLRTLGKSLFDVVVPTRPPPDGMLSMLWMILESSSPTGVIPKLIHTHGPMTASYKTQPVIDQKRDYFLFSHPDDQVELNTLFDPHSQIKNVPTNAFFSFRKGYLISGIIPVNELREADRNIFSFDILLPSSFFKKRLNDWGVEPSKISDTQCREWRDLILNADFTETTTEITAIVATDDRDFCRQYVAKIKDFFRRIYFWSTKYQTLDNFYSYSLDKFPMKLKSKNIAHFIKNIHPSEPKLIIFYHCRSISPQISGLAGWYNNAYMNAVSRIETAKGRPLLARTYSNSAALGIPGGGFRKKKMTRRNKKLNRKKTRKNL